jgi:nucleoside-diphosphate-sugar epimerase
MVVGNGLIAKSFKSYLEKDDVIIFASGVSNSSISEKDNISFQREKDLINEYLKYKDKKFIYFSTCSISDVSKINPYIEHKIKMEKLIESNHDNYLIFRLPIVIGVSDNNNTFFNNIKLKIIKGDTITIYNNISRYIIDVDDLSNILPTFIENDKNRIINVCFNNKDFVSNIIETMEYILCKKCNKIFKDIGYNSDIDNGYFISKLESMNYIFDTNYNINVLKKYCIK